VTEEGEGTEDGQGVRDELRKGGKGVFEDESIYMCFPG